MRWLTNFYDFSFKWTATAAIGIHTTKAWLSQLVRFKNAIWHFRSRDELIRDVLLWIPTHGRAKAGRPARTYIQQLCEDTGCCPEDLPRAMNDREEWRERVRDIRATSTRWWWWWNLEKMTPKPMECFRLLFDHLAWIEHQFLSGIRDSRKARRDDERCGRSKKVNTPELIGQRVTVRVTMFRF